MNLSLVIQAIRQRAGVFAGRVAGAAQYRPLPESTALQVPCAFVIPLDDNPGDNQSQNVVRQSMNESFAVIVALSNVADERGQAASVTVDTVRSALWSALLGWSPDQDIYDGIVYEGGSLLSMDRARIWYQFEFSAAFEIAPEDGYQPTELDALPNFEGINFNLDAIEPWDPNRTPTGPDGRIEVAASAPQDGSLPAP